MSDNKFFQILVLVLAALLGFCPPVAHAQEGVPVQVMSGMPGPSNNCAGGFVPFARGELRIGAAGNCLGQTGVWMVINSTEGCLALETPDMSLTVTVIRNGVTMTVGTHTASGFRTCLPPGESAMFKGDSIGTELTGQAFLSPTGIGSRNGILTSERGFPIVSASGSYLGTGGALMLEPSAAGGQCGLAGDNLVFRPKSRIAVSIQNNQCDG